MSVPSFVSALSPPVRRRSGSVWVSFVALLLVLATARTPVLAAKLPQPATRILLEPVGLQPISSRYLLAGSSMLTLHYVDDTHLLVTFAARRLIRRTVDDPPTDQDHNADALLLELPSGRILARAEWLFHDHGQYLWNLGHGQFMLRVRDTFTTFAPLANLPRGESFQQRPFLISNRPVVAVILSSDSGLLTIETTDPLPDPLPMDASGDQAVPKRSSPIQLNLYRLAPPLDPAGRPRASVAGRAVSRRPIELPVSQAGIVNVLSQGSDRWAFDFRTHNGKTMELALFDSTCRPVPVIVSPTEFLAFGCHGGGIRQQLGAFNLRGDEMWEQTIQGPYVAPSFVYAPVAGRFAISRLSMNAAAIATDTLVPAQLNGQFVDVYQTDSGRLLLHLDCSPIARAGQNYAFSPDGMNFAAIREGAIEIYALPPLAPKERSALQLAVSTAPPPVDGVVDLSDPSPRVSKGKKVRADVDDAEGGTDASDDSADPALQLNVPDSPVPASPTPAAAAPKTPPLDRPTVPTSAATPTPSSDQTPTPDETEPPKPRKPPTLYNPAAPDPNAPPH